MLPKYLLKRLLSLNLRCNLWIDGKGKQTIGENVSPKKLSRELTGTSQTSCPTLFLGSVLSVLCEDYQTPVLLKLSRIRRYTERPFSFVDLKVVGRGGLRNLSRLNNWVGIAISARMYVYLTIPRTGYDLPFLRT